MLNGDPLNIELDLVAGLLRGHVGTEQLLQQLLSCPTQNVFLLFGFNQLSNGNDLGDGPLDPESVDFP